MKLTKSKLKHIIKEELKKVLKENFAERGAKADGLYVDYWKKAVENYYKNEDPANHYEKYDPDSEDPEAQSNVGFAQSHLGHLLYRNENGGELTIEDIFKAIEEGWDESSYEFAMQQDDY